MPQDNIELPLLYIGAIIFNTVFVFVLLKTHPLMHYTFCLLLIYVLVCHPVGLEMYLRAVQEEDRRRAP